MKVEIRIFATKDVSFDKFKEHFFGKKESFYLKNSETWLKYMLSLYEDTGLGPFQAIKVSSTPNFSKHIFDVNITTTSKSYHMIHVTVFFQLNVENCDLETEFRKSGCTIYDRVIRKIDNQSLIQVCLYLINLESDLHLR